MLVAMVPNSDLPAPPSVSACKGKPLWIRIGFAFAGIRTTAGRERSFRTQLLFSGLAGGVCLVIQPGLLWGAVLLLSCSLVLALELINAAPEYMIDHIHPSPAKEIGHAKDAAAGAVLLASIAAASVGAMMVAARWLS